MAVELVVKISEDTFFDLKKKKNRTEVDNAVLNGTPLPKGHGRLVDADAILEEPFGNTYRDINIAETIIEAEAPPVTPQSKSEDIAKAFQMGLAIGFGERHDELDRVIDEIKKVINKQNKELENQLNASVQNVIDRESEERNLCDSCIAKGCIFQIGIVRNHCDFYKGTK